jgi:uncharacterized membrane protein YhhN
LNRYAIILGTLCLAFAAGNIFAERKGENALRLATKIAASTSFVAIGAINAGSSRYASLVLAALILSWIGDVLLVWHSKAAFLAGLSAFLLAHAAFALAFATLGLDPRFLAVAVSVWVVVLVFLLRWLWPHLRGPFRLAVLVYMAAITVMVSLAGATASPLIAAAAAMFAISDIAVARDRFVERSIRNKLWGIPLYYIAQLLFAISIFRPGA